VPTRVLAAGGTFPIRILTPTEHPRGVIVYYHGGGWVLGGLDDSDVLGRQLAKRTGCAVVLVDYRLAPEYRYPTAVDDSWAALLWTADHLQEIAGQMHGFFTMVGVLPGASAGMDFVVAAIDEQLAALPVGDGQAVAGDRQTVSA
jgi:acetyl esterase/lipase